MAERAELGFVGNKGHPRPLPITEGSSQSIVTPMDRDSEHGPSNNSPHANEWTLQELIIVLRRGKWIILGSTAAVVLLTALYTFFSKPVYEATATVAVDARSNASALRSIDITGTDAVSRVTHELETLRSHSLSEAVVRMLSQKGYVDEARQRPIAIIREFNKQSGQWELSPTAQAVKRLTKAVDFSPVKDSDVMRVTVRSSDPEEAALIANTYTEAYAQRDLTISRKRSRLMREFLEGQLADKHGQLENAERTLQNYMTNSGMVSLDAETQRVVNQLSKLEAERDGLEVDIASAQKTLSSLNAELATQQPNVARSLGESSDEYLKILQGQIARLEVQRDLILAQSSEEATERVGMTADKLKDLERNIGKLKQTLASRTQSFLGSIVPESRDASLAQGTAGVLGELKQRIIEQQIELDGLVAKKKALSSVITDYDRQFNQIPRKSIQLAKLQRTRISSEKLYLLIEEKFNEAGITESSELGSVEVLDPAAVPLEPVSPRPFLNLAIGLLFGSALGLGIVLVRSSLDTKLRSPNDLKRLGIIPIGVIQQMGKTNGLGFASTMAPDSGKAFDRRLVTYFNPLLSDAEGYRHLRAAIQDKLDRNPLGVLAITSANPQEGKSTIAANLAVSFSLMEGSCLLVDADLRRPTVHTFYALERGPGLTNALENSASFEHVVHKNVIEKLDVLTAGDEVKNPSELLLSKSMTDLIEKFRSKYHVIIVDTPPLLAVSDAGPLTRAANGVLVVIQAGSTTGDMLDALGQRLKSQRVNFLGLVLNRYDPKLAYGSRGYGYHVGYGSYGYESKKTKSVS